MATRGRPDQREHTIITHVSRNHECIQVKELWTQHKIVPIAFQAQFMYKRKQLNNLQPPVGQQTKPSKNKKNTSESKKYKQQYQSSFVYMDDDNESDIDALKYIKQHKNRYPNLYMLMQNKDQSMQDLKDMVRILVQIKHQTIVDQFLEIYEIIIQDIYERSYEYQQSQARRGWEKQIVDKIINHIESQSGVFFMTSEKEKFKYFSKFMKQSNDSFRKLLTVTAYSFLAQKFNFNINEYYSDAFTVQQSKQDLEPKATKKVKMA